MKHFVCFICELSNSMISGMSFLKAKLFFIKQIFFNQISTQSVIHYSFQYFQRARQNRYWPTIYNSLYMGVTRAIFISSRKIPRTKELLNVYLQQQLYQKARNIINCIERYIIVAWTFYQSSRIKMRFLLPYRLVGVIHYSVTICQIFFKTSSFVRYFICEIEGPMLVKYLLRFSAILVSLRLQYYL